MERLRRSILALSAAAAALYLTSNLFTGLNLHELKILAAGVLLGFLLATFALYLTHVLGFPFTLGIVTALPDYSAVSRSATRRVPRHPNGAAITLVGSGPGSPDLLTIAAYESIRHADVIICDKIASKALKDLVPKHAEFHEADKIPGNADAAQAELNAWGIDALRQGKRVVRLKVGDPYLYGRGGEEFQFYKSQGYEPDVIPGITSALMAPLAAQIPVTHRGAANQLLITTGQGRNGSFPDLPTYDRQRTVVMLMAVGRIPQLRDDFCSRGYPETTPVAVIEKATHPDERTIRTTLLELKAVAEAAKVASPAIIVVGQVVNCLDEQEQDLKLVRASLGQAAAAAAAQDPIVTTSAAALHAHIAGSTSTSSSVLISPSLDLPVAPP